MRKYIVVSGLLMLGAALAAPAQAQKADTGAFFVRLGRDTIALERYIRTASELVAEGVVRTPQTRRYTLTVTFKEDGSLSWYEVLNRPVAGVPHSAPLMRSLATYTDGKVDVETWVNAVQRPSRTIAAKPNALPILAPLFYVTYETALMAAHHASGDSTTIEMIAGGALLPYIVRWIGTDSVTLYHPQTGTARARIDSDGHLLGLSGEGTTFKVEVTRAKWIDLDAFEMRFAAADAAGKGIGALSPRDSLEFDVGTGLATVSYGRPSKRGRTIFGKMVPWGEVWRTGANAATQIEFTDSVEINGVRVPPGAYTLWTIPDPKQWQVILNKQTGQWGTAYDEKQDLARILVGSESVPVPVETFTITAQRKSDVITQLTLTWDRTRVFIPIRQIK